MLLLKLEKTITFTVATNQTIFTVEKLASKITASLVSITYNIGKYLVLTL